MSSYDPTPSRAARSSSRGRAPKVRPGGDPLAARRRRRSWWLVYFMLVYGAALIVLTLALWYLFVAPGAPASAGVDCALGTLPPSTSSAKASLAARPTAFPAPGNGSGTPQTFELWVNASVSLLPGTNVSFQVRSLPGVPAGAACLLPIPEAGWQANATSVTLYPGGSALVAFTGAPAIPYARGGAFAAETWVNATNVALALGSTPVFLTVS